MLMLGNIQSAGAFAHNNSRLLSRIVGCPCGLLLEQQRADVDGFLGQDVDRGGIQVLYHMGHALTNEFPIF
jgi:hypothetical protein